MWNIDIEYRVREMNRTAEDSSARLVDTMTETDDSAKGTRRVVSRLAERIRQAFQTAGRSPRSLAARSAQAAPGK